MDFSIVGCLRKGSKFIEKKNILKLISSFLERGRLGKASSKGIRLSVFLFYDFPSEYKIDTMMIEGF